MKKLREKVRKYIQEFLINQIWKMNLKMYNFILFHFTEQKSEFIWKNISVCSQSVGEYV